jgi:hypothetical protein
MKNRKRTPQDPRAEIPYGGFAYHFKPKVQARISAMATCAAGKIDVADHFSRLNVSARAYQRIHRLVGASHPTPQSGDRIGQLDRNHGLAGDITGKGNRARPDRAHTLPLSGGKIHPAMPGTES